MKILVTDDDPLTLDALSACIEAEGFEVLTAENGIEALEIWERSSPDLICLDIMMPGLSGYQVCLKIRETWPMNDLPIIFLTATATVCTQ